LFFGCAQKSRKKVCFKNVCIKAEIADSESEQIRGLMFRKSLLPGSGMLFVFDRQEQHNFWMKNMRFPLDMIWIDSKSRVVDITKNALPCQEICETIVPKGESKYVLEVNAGFAQENRIVAQDEVRF